MIADLAVVTVVAAITSMLSRRFGQPSILGYLLAGLIVGPYIPIPLFADPQRMHELSEVGVVLVMFAVGLEFRIGRLLEILPVSGLTAVVQIASLWCAGYGVGAALGWSQNGAICLGTTLAISSTMVVSGVLRTRPVEDDTRAHIFGVLVVQDLVAILLMAVVTALAAGQTMELRSVGLLIGQLAGAVAVILLAAVFVLPRLVRFALEQGDHEVLVMLVAGAAFGLAMAAHAFGYSVALGAFLAGMAVAESGREHEISEAIDPLRSLFSAIFFVSIGMTVDPLVAWRGLPLALSLCAVVIVAQFLSVTLATVLTGGSLRKGIYAGLALGQIGELSFILATIAIAGGVLPREALPALVTVATITAFTTSLLLGRAQLIVERLDHLVPGRVHQLLSAYQAFLRRARASGDGSSLGAPLVAVLVDWAALVVLFIGHTTAITHAPQRWLVAIEVGVLVLAVPFLIGLVRSGRRLASGVRLLTRGRAGGSARSRAIEALALLAAVSGVGLPTLALLMPIVDGPWVEALVSGVTVVVLVVVGVRLGGLRDTHTSGVAQIAHGLAGRPSGAHEAAPLPALAGLDYQTWTVPSDLAPDGKELAALDLRARTGANVVAIQSEGEVVLSPADHHVVHAGDVLAVSGSAPALARARELLAKSVGAPNAPSPSVEDRGSHDGDAPPS